MGYEKDGGRIKGLGNAVMLSGTKAIFPRVWLGNYLSFRSKGFDNFWVEHSVNLPYKLSQQVPELKDQIHIEPASSFLSPYYHQEDLKKMFVENVEFEDAYCHHLWETFSYEKYFEQITVDHIKEVDTTYNLIARRFL